MTFLDTSSPLAQLKEFMVGETFGVSASVDKDDIWFELGDVFIEEYDLHETPIGTSCVDVVVAGPPNPNFVDNISPNPLDTFPASSSCSPPSPSPSIVICYLLILMPYLRGMRLTVLSPQVPLGGTIPPLLLIVST